MSRASVSWISGPVLRATPTASSRCARRCASAPHALLGEVVRIDGRRDRRAGVRGHDRIAARRHGRRRRRAALDPSRPRLARRHLRRPAAAARRRRFAVRPRGHAPCGAGNVPFAPRVRPASGCAGRASSARRPTPAVDRAVVHRAAGCRPATSIAVVAAAGDCARTRARARCGRTTARRATSRCRMRGRCACRGPVAADCRRSRRSSPGSGSSTACFRSRRAARRRFPAGSAPARRCCSRRWQKGCNADVIVYLGCGERGNEMAGVLDEFPRLADATHRAPADGAHRHHREHVEHAGRRARGVDLFRDHRRRVFSRPGTARRADGRLDVALGGGAARGVGPVRRTARRRRLSGVPVVAARGLLRARRAGRAARAAAAAR